MTPDDPPDWTEEPLFDPGPPDELTLFAPADLEPLPGHFRCNGPCRRILADRYRYDNGPTCSRCIDDAIAEGGGF